jgi:hypothetical protein
MQKNRASQHKDASMKNLSIRPEGGHQKEKTRMHP